MRNPERPPGAGARSAVFQRERSRLFGLAYRMLGSRVDAEDVLQDAFLRWLQTGGEEIRTPEAWLTTVVARLAVDRLRSAARQRETYPGQWLPEPILDEWSAEQREIWRAELSVAFLFVLERLTPDERAVFLLREAPGYSYREIAALLDKSEAACRQLMTRARNTLREQRNGYSPDGHSALQDLVPQYLEAVQTGDEERLLRLLARDAVLTSDGGGKVRAAVNPILGPERIVRFLLGLRRKYSGIWSIRPELVNAEPGLLLEREGGIAGVCAFACDGGRITRIFWIVNPDKLRAGVKSKFCTAQQS